MFGQTIKAQTVMAVSIYKKLTKLSISNKDNQSCSQIDERFNNIFLKT